MQPEPAAPVFALLDESGDPSSGDTSTGNASSGTSRLYTDWVREHRCEDPAQLSACWAAVETDQRAGLHALLLADYEWGARLQGLPERLLSSSPRPQRPALRVLMFGQLQMLDGPATEAWLQAQDAGAEAPSVAGALGWQADVSEADFHAAIARIHEAIRAGETYQVNHTYRLRAQAYGRPVALYRRLRQRQPVAFGALIALPPGPGPRWVLSRSPELFLAHRQGLLQARPMKGTAARQADAQADAAAAEALRQDPKNCAENLMIVDLLRNDLGRIAQVGSVRVPALFSVERYRTVHQMTSTIEAQVLPEVDMPALLRASFPCGSITGAPKRHTMGLIARGEPSARGLYCGAIGWVAPPVPGRRLGDFCLSVAIRTLTLGEAQQGLRPLQLGVGAGIVLDSVAADELAECQLKARFVTRLDPGFELFETLRMGPRGELPLRDAHLARLRQSAACLGFAWDEPAVRALLDAQSRDLQQTPAAVDQRCRLSLRMDGQLGWQRGDLAPLSAPQRTPDGALRVCLASSALPAHRPLAGHKTSDRAAYDAGVRAAEAQGCFDSLFVTPEGWLVEGGRSTVFVRLQGRWFTPPLAMGVLPGVMRAQVMADSQWAVSERPIHRDELAQAEGLMLANALRGLWPAVLV